MNETIKPWTGQVAIEVVLKKSCAPLRGCVTFVAGDEIADEQAAKDRACNTAREDLQSANYAVRAMEARQFGV